MADLAVAHLPLRQTDGRARRDERRMRALGPEPVEHRRLRELDRIARAGRRDAPAVEDDEGYESVRHSETKLWTSSDAPPTSAPSTDGCASSSAALSGLTEPPYSTGRSSSDLMNACASSASSGVAVLPVPIAHTGSYAITRSSCRSSTLTWRRSTSSVSPASRCASVSPTHAITFRPCSRADLLRRATPSSVSPKYWRRSEWPTIAPTTPRFSSMRGEISPVNAPS